MRERMILVLCWLVMLGNVGGCMYGVEHALEHRDPLEAMAAWAVAILSISCALILRARVLRSADGTAGSSRNAGGKAETHK